MSIVTAKPRRRGYAGWHRAKERGLNMWEAAYRPEPVVPSGWEKLLAELGLSEAHALELLRGEPVAGVNAHVKLRVWVRRCCWAHFVPEAALKLLGLDVQVNLHCDRFGSRDE